MILATGYTADAYKAHTLTFSQSLSNAVFNIYSLGSLSRTSSYTFTQPFQILSQNGYLSASGDATTGYKLTGTEGAGTIQFLGTYSSISWTVTQPEFYSGFTLGLTTTNNPDAAQQQDIYTFGGGVLPPPYVPAPDIVRSNNGQSGFNATSAVGNGAFNNRFAGGTLVVDAGTRQSPTTSSAFFFIAAGADQAFIDQNNNYSVFSGVFANDTSNGRLIIKNGNGSTTSGEVVLANGANTYSGGTEVQAGATLSIATPGAIGTGGLDLVGSATTPATLKTTATMTISARITVTGDPVFDVASGTTTTVSSAIADGAAAGDIVVTGGGTLALTAVNTYTGPTTINAASTLALLGSGSIGGSSAVANNGVLDLTGATSTVTLVGTYTQGSTGTLKLAASAGGVQLLSVGGAASLDGTLALVAASGTYTKGLYQLVSASSVAGRFGTFASNLSDYTSLRYNLKYTSTGVYLVLGVADAGGTAQALAANQNALRSVLSQRSSAMMTMMDYDCETFDAKGYCISARARYTSMDRENEGAGVFIAAYRLSKKVRFGGFVDYSAAEKDNTGLKLGNSTPTLGAFAAYSEHSDLTGFQAKASAAFNSGDVKITRDNRLVGTEPGSGKAGLKTYAFAAELGWGFAVSPMMRATPYAGVRYSDVTRMAYTEGAIADTVDYPISYNAYYQRQTSITAGVRFNGMFSDRVGYQAALGGEYDLAQKASAYSGKSAIADLESFSLANTGGANRSRVVASTGLFYQMDKMQRMTANVAIRGQAYSSQPSVTTLVGYQAGF
jgi:autotransporter-associated beta strand protein